jgi:hypothetical protein
MTYKPDFGGFMKGVVFFAAALAATVPLGARADDLPPPMSPPSAAQQRDLFTLQTARDEERMHVEDLTRRAMLDQVRATQQVDTLQKQIADAKAKAAAQQADLDATRDKLDGVTVRLIEVEADLAAAKAAPTAAPAPAK